MRLAMTMPIATLLLATGGGASAAPLCRDGKGLFTPCVGVSAPAGHRRAGAASAPDAAVAPPRARPHPDRPPLIDRGRSCRDGKGLFTPCPR